MFYTVRSDYNKSHAIVGKVRTVFVMNLGGREKNVSFDWVAKIFEWREFSGKCVQEELRIS